MKKVLFTLGILLISLSGCSKKNNEAPLRIIETSEILLKHPENPNRIGVGQFVRAYVTIKGDKTGFSYLWKDQYGFSSSKDTVSWFPSKTGKQKLELKLQVGGATKTLHREFDIKQCDYRLCFWGESMADIIVNEVTNSAYYHNKPNMPKTDKLPAYFYFVDPKDETIIYGYFLDENLNVKKGVDAYMREYDEEEWNNYARDFEKKKQEITQMYGKPQSDEIIWISSSANRDPKYLGRNIVNGACELKTTYSTRSTNIVLKMERGSRYGTVLFGAVYSKK